MPAPFAHSQTARAAAAAENAPEDRNQPLRGILYKITSVLLMVVMQGIVKYASDDIPTGEIMFFRSFFAIPVIVVWMAATGHLGDGWKTRDPIGHFYRGFAGGLSQGMIFAALGLLSFPEVTAIYYAAPLIVVILAAMFLGEQVRAFRLFTVGLGLAGVLIVLSPRLETLNAGDVGGTQALGAMLALTSAICGALAQVFIRKMVAQESTSSIVFWFSVNCSVLSLITLPWGWVMPSAGMAVALVLTGVLGGLGQVFLTASYRYADASIVAPFEYTSMVFALGAGWLIWSEVPSLQMLGGAALIMFAGILIILRERKLGLQRARQRRAMTGGS
ncbi:DMT family transporter [Frigidibacter sp. MR17.14]|uniref:DMT family transporter n=1 Tax=Frigidibacter sp. MR17.14 TaxID=3126509 RepID=UPI003FA52DD0